MYSSSDFEKLWFLYKTEGEPKGGAINSFYLRQGVTYRDFNSRFVKTRKKIVPVQIEGVPSCSEDLVEAQFLFVMKRFVIPPLLGRIPVTSWCPFRLVMA